MNDRTEVGAVMTLYADMSRSCLRDLKKELEIAGWEVNVIRTSVHEPRAVNGIRQSSGIGNIRRDFFDNWEKCHSQLS